MGCKGQLDSGQGSKKYNLFILVLGSGKLNNIYHGSKDVVGRQWSLTIQWSSYSSVGSS